MKIIQDLLLENKAWAKSKLEIDPHYFETMAIDQKPQFLWIGCSDSRVPESEITNSDPGNIFVHRNIANLVVNSDMNFLSVLDFGVNTLKVNHVIICGHYNCGGVKAALASESFGVISNWIQNIKDVYFTHKHEIESMPVETNRINHLVELNVREQVKNLSHNSIIQKAWQDRKGPFIHGWVYDLNNGLLKQLVTLSHESPIDSVYKYKF